MFAQIYICPTHGETWEVHQHEEIDIDNDEVYTFLVCSKCNHLVEPMIHDGKSVMHVLSEDEMRAEMGFYDDPDAHPMDEEEYETYDFGDEY